MINKYQFFSSGGSQTTIASIFISGDYAASTVVGNDIIDVELSYGFFDMTSNSISEFYSYNGSDFTKRLPDNNYLIFTANTSIVTGYTVTKDFFSLYSADDKNNYANNLFYSIQSISATTKIGIKFEDVYQNDTFVNVNLIRNFASLETLTIKNNAFGEWNQISSPTGVVFGTLTATQKLKDENGDFLKIPLRNVPMFVYNQTALNASPTNLTEGDSRTPLNMLQNSSRNFYTTDFSYNFDAQILPSVTTSSVTDTYRFSTITNEKGEFIITDVPTGIQTLILEIDLLKQGLTQEEVELNVSPYPKTNELSPEQIPSLIYREIPLQVLPSWGVVNTGYTNVDINLALDLRKWSTFFVPPITSYGKTYDEIIQAGFQPNVAIKVRDMANKNVDGVHLFPNSNIECVVIPDVKKRDYSRLLGWTNEVRQLRDLITFNQMEFNAFKLPANIYDPDAYKTDGSGNTISDKGVWLSSYEFKMFFSDENLFYRATGFNVGAPSNKLNVGSPSSAIIPAESNNYDESNNAATGGTLSFPFEKPWSANYPIKYSIPKLPSEINLLKQYTNEEPTNMLVPKYFDGDRVGTQTELQVTSGDLKFGGWGAQTNYAGDVYPNYFAQQVTTSELYKYEAAINTFDEFTNGYNPNYDYGNVPVGQKSQVKNGEVYQRVECGHAYFMWTQGYPRIINLSEYDSMYTADFLPEQQTNSQYNGTETPLYDNYLPENKLFNNDTLLATDFSQVPDIYKGYIYLYKIVNPDPNLLVPPQPPLQKRGINLNFRNIYIQRGGTVDFQGNPQKARLVPEDAVKSDNNFDYFFYNFPSANQDTKDSAKLVIKNIGTVSVEINTGIQTYKIYPSPDPLSFIEIPFEEINTKTIVLPTNNDFDYTSNTYHTTNYEIYVKEGLKFHYGGPTANLSYITPDPLVITIDGALTANTISVSGKTLLDGYDTYVLVSRVKEVRVRGTQFNSPPLYPSPNINSDKINWGLNTIVSNRQVDAEVKGLVLTSTPISPVEVREFRLEANDIDAYIQDQQPILPYKIL